jgi:hypothetical protein
MMNRLKRSGRTHPGPALKGLLRVDDIAMAVTDTGGSGIPVVYLNGQFAPQMYWRRVTADMGPGWRHTGQSVIPAATWGMVFKRLLY